MIALSFLRYIHLPCPLWSSHRLPLWDNEDIIIIIIIWDNGEDLDLIELVPWCVLLLDVRVYNLTFGKAEFDSWPLDALCLCLTNGARGSSFRWRASFHKFENSILQILFTMPVPNAEAERSFSALKRLKTYLCSTMNARNVWMDWCFLQCTINFFPFWCCNRQIHRKEPPYVWCSLIFFRTKNDLYADSGISMYTLYSVHRTYMSVILNNSGKLI